MASVTALPTGTANMSAGTTHQLMAAKALANDENYCQIDTITLDSAAPDAVFYSEWDDIASGLPATSTITGVQVLLPEMYGNVSQVNMYLSIDAGSAYSSAEAVDISGIQKSADTSVTTPSSVTNLWGLTWDPGSLDWNDVWLQISVNGGTSGRLFKFDYIQLKVYYSDVVIQKSVTINGSLTLNGQLIIK